MVTIKTPKEIKILREGGRRLAAILQQVITAATPGVSAAELDAFAEKLIRAGGDVPSFLGHKSKGTKEGFPATLCVSINNEIVHSLPLKEKVLKEGDIVALDLGLVHQGLFLDSAVTVGIGTVDKKAEKLISVTKRALEAGIKAARPGNSVGDIGFAIETFVTPFGFGIVRELAGHGVGYAVHEEPFIPNFGKRGTGVELKAGMVIAIEPMLNEGGAAVVFDTDGFTVRTADGSRSAHFEHTVLISKDGPEVLTTL